MCFYGSCESDRVFMFTCDLMWCCESETIRNQYNTK